MQRRIKTVFIDDEKEYRCNLVKRISTDVRLDCCGSFDSASEAISRFPRLQPDVTVLNFMKGFEPADLISRLGELSPKSSFMICTDKEDMETIFSVLEAGAKGYVLKSNGHQKILDAIITIYNGGASISSEVLCKILSGIHRKSSLKNNLTPRENEILNLLSKGGSYQEISDELFISIDTVRSHTQHIYKKLGVRSRTQAMLKVSAVTI